MGELKKQVQSNVKQYTMILIVVVITVFFQVATKGVLLLPQNVSNLVQQNAYVVILSVGMMICILTGGNIDLSVGSVVAFIGAICGWLIIGMGWNSYVVILICIAVSILAGMWHGFWIARFEIPSFIATLSGMLVFRGLTYTVLQGKTYFSYPNNFLALSTGFIGDPIGSNPKLNLTTVLLGGVFSALYIVFALLQRRKKMKHGIKQVQAPLFALKVISLAAVIFVFMYLMAKYKGLPVVFIPVAIIIIVYSFVLNNTVAGRHIYAVGGNQKAAKLSGVNVKKVMFFTYVNMAFLSALAGLVFTARLNSASPMAGQGFELDAIAACYIGGASSTGGIGTIGGALIGALVMGLLNNGMSILGVDLDIQMVIKGLVLLLAVFMDLIQKNKSRA